MKRFTLRKSAKSTIKRHIIFILSTLLLLQSGCSAGSLETLFKKKQKNRNCPVHRSTKQAIGVMHWR